MARAAPVCRAAAVAGGDGVVCWGWAGASAPTPRVAATTTAAASRRVSIIVIAPRCVFAREAVVYPSPSEPPLKRSFSLGSARRRAQSRVQGAAGGRAGRGRSSERVLLPGTCVHSLPEHGPRVKQPEYSVRAPSPAGRPGTYHPQPASRVAARRRPGRSRIAPTGWPARAPSTCRAGTRSPRAAEGCGDGYAAAATPLTSAHVSKARVRAARYRTAVTWSRRRWKRLLIWSWAERKRCACRGDLKRFICRSRRRVGWCETLWGGR